MIKILCAFFLISYQLCAFSQTHSSIRTGRPGQAIGPYVVGTDYLQIQSGYDHAWQNGDTKLQTALQNNVIRYGADERFELSSVVSWQHDSISAPAQENKEGISDFQLGFRYNINDRPDGIIPGFGVQTRFKLTNIASDYRSENLAPVIIFVANHNLIDTLALGTNLGITYSGNDTEPKYTFVSNLSFPIAERWSSFFEIYGNSQNAVASVYADTGLAYLYSNDLQIDGYLGGGKNHGVSEFFLSVGFSWRFKGLGDRSINTQSRN